MTMGKTLKSLAETLQAAGLLLAQTGDGARLEVSDIQYDSRRVTKGTLFLCKGAHFSPAYLAAAVDQGACAYLSDRPYPEAGADFPFLQVKDIRQALAVTANWFFDAPWRDLHMMGVTGTKGKSTTVTMVKAIFDAAAEESGAPLCGITSSVCNFDGVREEASKLTTPENIDLYRHLARAREAGLRHMVVEVSSQALKYHRVGGIRFDDAVFLNIAPDHIGPIEHPSFEDYFTSKLSIFDRADCAFVNQESDELPRIMAAARHCRQVVRFGLHEGDYIAEDLRADAKGLNFNLAFDGDIQPFHLPMHGRFNVENALAAIALAHQAGIPLATCAKALAGIKMTGHMSYLQEAGITVVVDYAHNEISFRRVLETVRQDFPDAPIWLLFGAPGDKAESRRPGMGRVASLGADHIILTADDPATEEVATINDSICRAFEKDVPVEKIEDRATAVRHAVQTAPEGAVVLLLGKGYETCQKIKGERVPYAGDEVVAKAALLARKV